MSLRTGIGSTIVIVTIEESLNILHGSYSNGEDSSESTKPLLLAHT